MNKKRLTAIALASCLTICLASPAFAYDYKVEVSGGTQGTYTGTVPSDLTGTGKKWVPDADDIDLKDGSKYYVKGFHISGEGKDTGAIEITEDTTFVATYGIKGDQDLIDITIHYQDEDGNTLAEDSVYKGQEEDRPIIPYKDIEGYMPRDTYNITLTLREDGIREYTFYYVPSTTTTTTTETTTTTVTTPAEGTAAAGTAAGGATAGGAAAGGAAAGGAGAAGAAGGAAAGPADIVDLDEGEVPLAGVDDANGDNGDGTGVAGDEEVINDDQVPTAGISTAAKAGIGVIIAAAIVAIIAALAVRARRKKNDETV